MKFDRSKFFSGVRDFLKSEGKTLTQKRTDALEFLIGAFEQANWSIPYISYALATIYHETAHTFEPIYEMGPRSYFNKYEPGTRIGRNLGNTEPGDGYLFRGAGYVQITGRANYRKFGLEDAPQQAINPSTALSVLVEGMKYGKFTGKRLSDYISDTGKDYKNARKIINGLDKAGLIAGYANRFEEILRASKTSAQDSQLPATKVSILQDDGKPSDTPAPDFTGGAAIVQPTGEAPPSLVAVQTPVVEVEQVKPEQESVIDTTITKWSARFVAVPTALLSFLGGVWAWMTNSPTELVMTLIIAGAVVAVIYFVGKMFVSALDKARQDRLQAAREQRAHEIQKLTLESAMHKDLNTVRVVPQPLLNSDNPANEAAQ